MASAGGVNILSSAFLFMSNSSYLGRWGGLGWVRVGRGEAHSPQISTIITSWPATCPAAVSTIAFLVELSAFLPPPKNQGIVPKPQ